MNDLFCDPHAKLTGEIYSKQSGEMFISGVKQNINGFEKCLKVTCYPAFKNFGYFLKFDYGLR